jgi:L-histidine N-alpha-methyltransferase
MCSKSNPYCENSNAMKIANKKVFRSRFQQEFADDVLNGLSHSPKSLPCKYIYDKQGTELFQKIMALPEYYLTNCEIEILKTHGKSMMDMIGHQQMNLVELGAGNGEKTRILVQEFMKRKTEMTLIPIDISRWAIDTFTRNLKSQIPGIRIKGLVSEYFKGLRWLSRQNKQSNLVLFLGSNIGNFEPPEADTFLSGLWDACNDGDFLLIGFDLKKEVSVLLDAYNDSQGVTALFNLNLLKRINLELGGHFDPEQYKYRSIYDSVSGSMKSYLISRRTHTVAIDKLNRSFSFGTGEPIHTESSSKYRLEGIEDLARRNGYSILHHFFDRRRYFADSLWQISK